jgi:hypothetical protein
MALRQYRSLKHPNGLFDVNPGHWFVGSSPQREVAHLAFDAAGITAASAGFDAFLEDFVEDGVMQGRLVLRGEWPQSGEACGG